LRMSGHSTQSLLTFPTKDVTISPDCLEIEVAPRDPENHYSLLGVTCALAFQYEDSELAKRSELIARFPKYKSLISFLIIPE